MKRETSAAVTALGPLAFTAMLWLVPAPAPAEEASSWAVAAGVRYRVVADQTYLVADGQESKLDLYVPREATAPAPTMLYIHGGGWVGGSKESSTLALLPYLEQGWAVVNVEYRLGSVALAPGAVEDCRCALRWVRANAATYNLDPARVVVTGHSAGGHLSLTTGMLTASAGFDHLCPKRNQDPAAGGFADVVVEEMPVAAIVNWFGITDVGDLLAGENAKTYAVQWMGSRADRFELAKQLSPLQHVRAGLPPILTLHGDADPIVPYDHAVRLHRALAEAGVPNQLHTIPGGGHGGFDLEQTLDAYRVIRDFLARYVPGSS
jgi:acetyl esterase/lipase